MPGFLPSLPLCVQSFSHLPSLSPVSWEGALNLVNPACPSPDPSPQPRAQQASQPSHAHSRRQTNLRSSGYLGQSTLVLFRPRPFLSPATSHLLACPAGCVFSSPSADRSSPFLYCRQAWATVLSCLYNCSSLPSVPSSQHHSRATLSTSLS